MSYAKEDSEINAHYNRGSDRCRSKGFLSDWTGTLSARRLFSSDWIELLYIHSALTFVTSKISDTSYKFHICI